MRYTWLACTVAALSLTATAAQNTAWFGTPLPPPASDPKKPILKYDDVYAPLSAHFAHRPGRSDETLDAAALKTDQEAIVRFSFESLAAGEKVWGRRAGTSALTHTLEWVAASMKAAGLADAHVEPFGVKDPMWRPTSWKVELVADPAFGAGSADVTLASAFPQSGGATIQGG